MFNVGTIASVTISSGVEPTALHESDILSTDPCCDYEYMQRFLTTYRASKRLRFVGLSGCGRAVVNEVNEVSCLRSLGLVISLATRPLLLPCTVCSCVACFLTGQLLARANTPTYTLKE